MVQMVCLSHLSNFNIHLYKTFGEVLETEIETQAQDPLSFFPMEDLSELQFFHERYDYKNITNRHSKNPTPLINREILFF